MYPNRCIRFRRHNWPCYNSYFCQIIRNYAFKSDLKIKWVRPPKIPCIKPEKSGDLASLPPVDKKQYPLEFQNSEELKTADKLVKRVFSLEFFPRSHSMRILSYDMISSVRRHALDVGSAESRIAQMTAAIRNLQQVMEGFPRDKRCKVQLKELIDLRKKWLKYLRCWDYKRFEWLLEKLDLVYKPPPSHFHWITRKDSLRKLTNKHCAEIKQQKLDAYKASLEAQQMDFLREKAQKLRWIRKEEEECGVEPTVSETDVEQVLKQLRELELGKEERLKDKAN
ncbi:28S ribosomal protein S15, mitochondrial [Cryptotermes secundus]|uniref:28S ribosomal protein S15, mitochondrial n=1 Tax=Cryptotermes secundus TaxID=105785 RepID=UPI000CD7D8BE|nr:28S ribosomal protein S15, mitochondrial [Cryptotermes secundus]